MPDLKAGVPLQFKGGINRDNTRFTMNVCTGGEWVRFWFERPRKIGGYRNLVGDTLTDIARGAWVVSRNGTNNYFAGTKDKLFNIPVSDAGVAASEVDVTPPGFIASSKNVWQFDDMFDVGTSQRIIFAHAAQNLGEIANSIEAPVYYGDPQSLTPLLNTGQNVSGGVCCLHPYPMLYGNDGYILWPAPGTVNFDVPGVSGSARITGSKIIKGASIRGGAGYSPAGLFWSLDNLNRIYFVGGQIIFANESVGSTYLLSSSAVVEYNGLFFWPSADGRFSYWNGGINDLPNNYNQRFFFENLNYAQRQKVFGVKVGAFNEIWWFWPRGDSEECNHVNIFNVKEGTWYDTPCARSCAVAAKVFNYPVMFANTPNTSGGYPMWQHEYGTDEVDGTSTLAIRSYFDIPIQTLVDTAKDCWLEMKWFEPDFMQTGNLTFQLRGQSLPQGAEAVGETFTITPNTAKIEPLEQFRYMSARIESNVAGGFYYMGKPIMKLAEGNNYVGNE